MERSSLRDAYVRQLPDGHPLPHPRYARARILRTIYALSRFVDAYPARRDQNKILIIGSLRGARSVLRGGFRDSGSGSLCFFGFFTEVRLGHYLRL